MITGPAGEKRKEMGRWSKIWSRGWGQTYIQVGEDGVGLETPHSFSLLRQTMVVD